MIAGWPKIEVDLRTDDRDDQARFPGELWWARRDTGKPQIRYALVEAFDEANQTQRDAMGNPQHMA